MSELKPCPFCKGEATLFNRPEINARTGMVQDAGPPYGAQCLDCTAVLPAEHPTEADAIAAWNRRADGWVSVEERLPDHGTDVLVKYWEDHRVPSHLYDVAEFRVFGPEEFINPNNETVYEWRGGHGHEFGQEVTHWMPLPAAPPEAGQ